MPMLDNATVKAVELTSPKHSKRDAGMLHGQLVNGQIFAAFSLQDREVIWIWSELSKIAGLITSFFSFFADINYLTPACTNVTDLPPPTEPLLEEAKTKRTRLAKARPAKVDEVVLSNFAALAVRLGFKSD
ncbi:hypothetical protein BKA61DRAFT_575424 [Leptodontidium sp. MPI-SDFR-AT-0119]|nr:hypothetical protein BKA61DRAFT_575424 [Leptodontidium sp. MPI-SDFR-AT-0119]